MTNLETLNVAEQELLQLVKNVAGLMKEKFQKLEENGVFAKYNQIYEDYVSLIQSETEGLEALKRSLFLLWYEQAEPPCFTGIYDLPKSVSRKVFNELNKRIETKTVGLELQWMLPFYNLIAEWVFDNQIDFPNLHKFLSTADNELYLQKLKAKNFSDRGQMGVYWMSISESVKN